MKASNVNGTSQITCECGSWLNHWKNFSGQALSQWCSEKSCIKAPEVGAHVQKDNSTDKAWYIVPLCKPHNGETGKSLELVGSVAFVSANVSQTCGK